MAKVSTKRTKKDDAADAKAYKEGTDAYRAGHDAAMAGESHRANPHPCTPLAKPNAEWRDGWFAGLYKREGVRDLRGHY